MNIFIDDGGGAPSGSHLRLLLQGDGGWTDDGPYNNTVTPGSQATIDSTNVRWGSGSMAFNGSPTAQATIASAGTSTTFNFDDNDFTIAGWIRFNVGNDWGVFEKASTLHLYGDSDRWVLKVGTVNVFVIAWTPTPGTWYHFECSRSGATTRMFIDGTSIGSGASVNAATGDAIIRIGQSTAGGAYRLNGNIDSFVVYIGIALHSSNFTPPTGPYSP